MNCEDFIIISNIGISNSKKKYVPLELDAKFQFLELLKVCFGCEFNNFKALYFHQSKVGFLFPRLAHPDMSLPENAHKCQVFLKMLTN